MTMWAGEGRRRALLQLTVQKSPLIPQLPHNPFGGTLTLFRFRYSLEPHLLKCRGTKQPSYPYGGFLKMGVPLKSSTLIRFSLIKQPFWGTPIHGNPHIYPSYPHNSPTKSDRWTACVNLMPVISCYTTITHVKKLSHYSLQYNSINKVIYIYIYT